MSRYVCDASVIASFILPDEWTSLVPEVMAELRIGEVWAPAHLPIEIVSLLVSAERRGRIDRPQRLAFLEESRRFIELLDAVSSGPSIEIAELAIATGLSVYDAAYLEIAQRRQADLATNDRKLIAAAANRGVTTLSTFPARP